MQNHLKNELYNILSGKSEVRFGTIIQTIACYLDHGSQASSNAKREKHHENEETEKLENFIFERNLWINDLDISQYVSEGAEQKVYLKDSEHVFKFTMPFITIHGKIISIIYFFIIIFFRTQLTN